MNRVWIVTLSLFLVARSAGATVLVPLDLGALSRDAQVIARGRVLATGTRWTDDRRGVETLVTLEVESYLKGAFGETLTFRVPGGRLGRYRSLVVGAPEFTDGQRVIVFLSYRGPMVPYLVGLGQGVYRLAPAGTRWVVTPPALVAVDQPTPLVRGDVSRRPLALDDFERRVRDLAGDAR
jgi:hypothetical protein